MSSHQPPKKRKQVIISAEPPPMNDVIEAAEMLLVGNASDADDEAVEVEENPASYSSDFGG